MIMYELGLVSNGALRLQALWDFGAPTARKLSVLQIKIEHNIYYIYTVSDYSIIAQSY
jgi:hypothetical protein